MGRPAALLVILAALTSGGIVGSRAAAVGDVVSARASFSNNNVYSPNNGHSGTVLPIDNVDLGGNGHPPAIYARAEPLPVNDIVFNYTVSDMSPMLIYTPSASGAIDQTWQNSFSGSKPAASGTNVFGQGLSAHTSSAGNAYLTFEFVGTGVYFFGTTSDPTDSSAQPTNAAVRLTIDGINIDFSPTTMPDSLLGFKDKLSYGAHSAVLSVLRGTVSLRNVEVLTQLSSEAPDFASTKVTENLLYDGKKVNTDFDISGDWFPVGSIGGDDNTPSESLTVLNGRPGAAFTYSVPANTSFLVVNGTTQPTNAYYTLSVSPSPPGSVEFPLSLNAFQGYNNPTAFFFTPLDPNETYNLTFSVRADTNGIVGVHSVKTYSSIWTNNTTPGNATTTTGGLVSTNTGSSTSTSGPTTPSSSSDSSGSSSKSRSIVGPVVGGVVGGVAGLLLIAAAIWFCVRRRTKTIAKPRPTPDENFVIDDDVHATPYPYEMTQQRATPPSTQGYNPRMSHFSDASTTPLTDPTPSIGHGGVQGFVPSPASPTLTASTMTTTGMLGFGVMNDDGREELTTNSRGSTIAAQKRAAAQRAAMGTAHPPQERDAGRWDAEAEEAVAAMKTVPPSYDPSWAGDFSDGISNTFGGTAAGTVIDEPISPGSSGPERVEEESEDQLANTKGGAEDSAGEMETETESAGETAKSAETDAEGKDEVEARPSNKSEPPTHK